MVRDLSSTMARIMPNATRNLGTFHSSGFSFTCGNSQSINMAAGKTAPQAAKPPTTVTTPGDQRGKRRQNKIADMPKESVRAAMRPGV
jgi:hypothetical protein